MFGKKIAQSSFGQNIRSHFGVGLIEQLGSCGWGGLFCGAVVVVVIIRSICGSTVVVIGGGRIVVVVAGGGGAVVLGSIAGIVGGRGCQMHFCV